MRHLHSTPFIGGRFDFHKIALNLILIIDIAFTSRLYRLFPLLPLQAVLLGMAATLILIYILMCLVSGYLGVAVGAMCGGILICFQLYHFSDMFATNLDINAAFQLIFPLTFVIFFCCSRLITRKYILQKLMFYSNTYVIIYDLVATAHKLSLLPQNLFEGLVAEDPERGTRLFAYFVALAYAWFGWLDQFRRTYNRRSVLMLAMCLLAFFFAQSRVFTVLLIMISTCYWLNISEKSIQLLCFGIFCIPTSIFLYGFIDDAWNPFMWFLNDSSGNMRMNEYNFAREMLIRNPVFGIGFAPSQWHAWQFLNYAYFSANDLGAIGVWFDWGLIGMCLYGVSSYVATIPQADLHGTERTTLFLTGCLIASAGCIAPLSIYPAGATFFAAIFGLWLASKRNPATSRLSVETA